MFNNTASNFDFIAWKISMMVNNEKKCFGDNTLVSSGISLELLSQTTKPIEDSGCRTNIRNGLFVIRTSRLPNCCGRYVLFVILLVSGSSL
jgi:hypothetical protein